MDPASPLLALRLGGQDHALEPGRDYLIGSAPDCDLRLLHGVAPRHARLAIRAGEAELIDLGSPQGTWHNEQKVERSMLQIGDLLRLGDTTEAVIVPDHGNALLIPIPALRQAAGARAVRIAAQALRRDSQTFQELMAHELRRAPWFALSLALHLVLAMLLWWLLPNGPPSGATRATVGIELAGDVPEADDGPPSPPEVIAEPESPPLELLQTPEPPAPSEVVPLTSADAAMPRPPELPRDLAPIGHRARATDGASASAGDGQLAGLGSGGFQRTVGELRRSGLEIVFVFDSTGSMTRTIHDTKSSITQMLRVLRALVPDARIGLVTYRDRGEREQYLVRQVPLGLDPWRAANFMQFVSAEGGGDRPEDVRAGLQAAFSQPWRSGARRVVVLAGDAPPHPHDQQRLLADVKAFVRDGRSFVHTLVTSPEQAGEDTHTVFRAIAEAGNGSCEGLHTKERVLQRVLTMAFGRDFDQDIATVVRAIEVESERVDTASLALVRLGGPQLAKALRQQPMPATLWNALVRIPRRATAEQLVDVLSERGLAEPIRQAAAAALQRLLELPLPPIDPEPGAEPTAQQLGMLRRAAARLPD